jgi:hypothetical protein
MRLDYYYRPWSQFSAPELSNSNALEVRRNVLARSMVTLELLRKGRTSKARRSAANEISPASQGAN